MFSQYQNISGSEEDSSHSQTVSYPGAYSSKKKVIPLHLKIRHSKKTNNVLKPLRIVYTSPESTKNFNLSNASQEREVLKERFVDNSLGNIQETPEKMPPVVLDNLIPSNCVDDSLEDLFPSDKPELNDVVHKLSDCSSNSQMDLSEIHEQQESETMEVSTPVLNNITNFFVVEDIGNQRDALHSKMKLDIKKTPVRPNWSQDIHTVRKKNNGKENNIHPNWNQDIHSVLMKENNDKEKNISTYHNRFTPGPHVIRSTPSATPLQPVPKYLAVSNQIENKNVIPLVVKKEIFNKKKIEFQTPDKVPRNARSVSVMMPPPPVPQIKLTPEQKFLIINGKNYEMQFMLGRGGSSKVYQVLDPESSYQLAVKEVDLSLYESSLKEGYLQEIDLLRKLQGSENVIKMIDFEYNKEKEKLYVVMEKGETDLSRLIKEITKIKLMPISTIVHYWTEMLRAVKDIHAKNVIHSDLKPANFLLVCGRLKLIDFGIASSVQIDMTSVYKDVQTGTYNYISPEALQGTSSNNENHVIKISYKSDIWSLGCILYNLLYGKTPFQHIVPNYAKCSAISNKNHCIEYPSTRKDCPPILLYAVKKCLTYDPKKRPTAAELLELPYFNPLAPESCLPG